MSKQRNPITDPLSTDSHREAKYRKIRREKASKPSANNYAVGDRIVVTAKERNGFSVFAIAEVVDVFDHIIVRSWRHSFNLVVRIINVDQARYIPVLGHLIQVETDPDAHGYFGGRWALSRMKLEEYPA